MKRHGINLLVTILFVAAASQSFQTGTIKGIIARQISPRSSFSPSNLSASVLDGVSCTENLTAPPIGPYHWPVDKQVAVYFSRHMFTPEQRQALVEAMASWTFASETGSGVRFLDAGETDSSMTCSGCLTVGRKVINSRDRRHYAFFHPMREEGRLLSSARIDFDFGITNPNALKCFMVHELGHSMGLWDCVTCGQKKTIMNCFHGINKDNGLIVPSACDLVTVRSIYQRERQLARTYTTASAAAESSPQPVKRPPVKTNSW